MFGTWNVKGTALDKQQLENYLEKLASDNVLKSRSDKESYPIPRMIENFNFITKVYYLLNTHLKLGIHIHPAGEWILDNYYIIEETVKSLQHELTLKKYKNFLGLENGPYKGVARIYFLAVQMCAYTDSQINSENLTYMLQAYQNKKYLNMDEIWNIGLFIQIALIENIAEICEKIYSSQMQKYKVENIIERIIEGKENQEFKLDKNYKTQKFGFGEMKYPFIEYMSYRLKKEGKKAYGYLDALEEQVNKIGTTVSDVIQKEHFDIALRRVSMGNSIRSLKEMNRINFLEIFEKINGVEEILKKDPANVYEFMDYKTKEYYRNQIKEIAKKSKISEMYIAKKVIDLAEKAKKDREEKVFATSQNNTGKEKKAHIGYYLIDEGKETLYQVLGVKKHIIKQNTKVKWYISCIYMISFFISLFSGIYTYEKTNGIFAILMFLFTFIPVSEIILQIVQQILNKTIKPKLIPKMDFYNGIEKENATMVVIPTIINSKEKLQDLFGKLEVYYLANQTENLYFTLLGDCSSEDQKTVKKDEEIINLGKELAKELNKKYEDRFFPKFHFLYRTRKWNEGEGSYLGWERKRGLLNQFNRYILEKEPSDFIVNTIEDYGEEIPKIKYVITLDADTDLVLNSAFELVGAMAHILNKPVLDKEKNIVVEGHALIQPKVGIDLIASRKTLFTKIFAGSGGTDLYTNAISDVYQDNFGEGIFTGKGIYDISVFEQVLKNEIPENTVLSHDLLEGCYLRCGLASDILLMDGYPCKYNSFMSRLHRWIRGDWQISKWIKNKIIDKNGNKKKNPLNLLSKYKILDNLRRSMLEISCVLLVLFSFFLEAIDSISTLPFFLISFVAITIPMILEIINRVVHKKDGEKLQKMFSPVMNGYHGDWTRMILNFAFFPYKAWVSLDAIVKTIYRKTVSKKHLLEWTTAEEAEKNAKTDVWSYYKSMWFSILFSIFILLFALMSFPTLGKIVVAIFSLLWILSPYLAYKISKEKKQIEKIEMLTEEERNYLLEIGKKTWNYFKENLNEKTNYLPPDNYQENRKEKWVYRTSSTNIGLGLLAAVSSYDLGFETLEDTIQLISNMLNTIESLSKWNGHLYNWYEIKTLEPLVPRYISTVDSGNFIGYLYVLKKFLEEHKEKNLEQISFMIEKIDHLIKQTDFSVLYHKEKRIFSIGFNVEENKLTDSYYDLLASEARQASLIAISKKDVPVKHWNNLSRTLTPLGKYQGLISWSGTAFEYLMPNINIPKYPGSLLDESCHFMVMSQMQYSESLKIPWGISESAFNLKDLNGNYQYKAFGIPWLGLKRGLADEVVVSSYGSVLAITDYPKEVLENIKRLEQEGIMGRYGMYEAIDYTSNRLKYGETKAVVKTFMAHHQGLILLSLNNLFQKNILQKRFMKNPEIRSMEILLQERMPENVIITKEKKEKPEKLIYKDSQSYFEKVYTKIDEYSDQSCVIANENYTIVCNQKGESYSKYKNYYINRYKETADLDQGIFFYIKDVQSKRIWTSNHMSYLPKPDQYKVYFSSDSIKIDRMDGDLETRMKITVASNEPVEIRNLEIENHGNNEALLEITGYFEPVLSTQAQDVSHMAFNNLFLRYHREEETNSIIIERRPREESGENLFLGVNLYTENETIGELEYEIDREKFYGRSNLGLPQKVEHSNTFSKSMGLVTEPAVAMKRTVRIKPNDKISFQLILVAGNKEEEIIPLIQKYSSEEKIKKTFELVKAKSIEEARYLELSGKEIETSQEILSYLIKQNPMKKLYISSYAKRKYKQEELWKFGISGDDPILLVKIRDANDIYVIEELLKIYEYLKIKNIEIELVILNQEKYSYEQYVKEAIENAILNRHLSYLKNRKAGIFVLNEYELSKEDKEILEYRSNLKIDAHWGNLKSQLEQMQENYKNSIKNIGNIEAKQIVLEEEMIRGNELDQIQTSKPIQYYNEYGAFFNEGKEYVIKVNEDSKLPTVWSHILANKHFGTVLTEGMGGYTWSGNSRLNRISAWNNNPCFDIPSEIIYLKDLENGKAWSLGSRPMPDKSDYYITYGFGYAKYEHTSLGIIQQAEIFVPREEKIKINKVTLKNTLPKKKKLKIFYYVKAVLGEDELKTNGNIQVKKENNIVYAQNLYTDDPKQRKVYITCSEEIHSYTGNKKFFLGNSGLQNPVGIHKVSLDCEDGLGQDSCIAIEFEMELEPYERKEFSICLGEEENLLDMKNIAYQYSNLSNCKQELLNVKKYWQDRISRVQVETPLESFHILLNGWLIYQIIVSRLYGRTGYYQSGGAIGYRDQLQDTLGLKYMDPTFMKEQIIEQSKHQFIEGDVEHWWHPETKRGIRTKFSDDLLWLVYLVEEYIKTTGDKQILEIEINYLKGNLLEENQIEKYDLFLETDQKGNIYEHCIKAIERSLKFGENGLPKIGSGDWNDGLSNVGPKGKGESVWLGFFLYKILKDFIPIIKEKGEEERANTYEEIIQNLKKALNKNAWDGRWFKRAFMDDGQILGSIENEECRIDSIAQSWSVISGAGDNDKKYISMESLENHLVDKENGIIKLLDPPFDKGKLKPGYIKSYLPGVRENGGQYTHGAIWAIIAEAMLGFGEKAFEFFKMINPIEHARTKEAAQKYKVEPYVVAADVYGAQNLAGRGGWTWYTGSSSWLYLAGIEYILGLKVKNGFLRIEPCIPKEWEEYKISYQYGKTKYKITIKNPEKKNTGIARLRINGMEREETQVKLMDDGKIYEIEAIL